MIRSLEVLLLVSIGLLLNGLIKAECPSSADGCINKDKFDQLSTKDPSYYCEQGAILSAEAQNCLRDCSFSEDNTYLQQQKKSINDFCKTVDSKCEAVSDTLVTQTRCFEQYGGLERLVNNITNQFINGNRINCQELYWGRYCQRTQSCSFNERLDIYIVKQNPSIALALAICGSETIKGLIPYLDRTDGCKADAENTIRNTCNVSCGLANAQDTGTLCRLFESQAECLEKHVTGCTALERRLVLPRLNSYAIANKYLRCSVKYRGLPVKPAGKECSYSDLINSCMLTGTLENTLTFYQLQPLFNLDNLVINFCSTKGNESEQVVECRNNFIPCAPVQNKLLVANDSTDISSFLPEIGVFPLDQFGMKYIYDTMIPPVCPKGLHWSDRICVPDFKRDEEEGEGGKKTETTVELSTKDADTTLQKLSTKDSRTTPQKETPSRPSRGTTPDKRVADGFKRVSTTGRKKVHVARSETDTVETGHCKATRN